MKILTKKWRTLSCASFLLVLLLVSHPQNASAAALPTYTKCPVTFAPDYMSKFQAWMLAKGHADQIDFTNQQTKGFVYQVASQTTTYYALFSQPSFTWTASDVSGIARITVGGGLGQHYWRIEIDNNGNPLIGGTNNTTQNQYYRTAVMSGSNPDATCILANKDIVQTGLPYFLETTWPFYENFTWNGNIVAPDPDPGGEDVIVNGGITKDELHPILHDYAVKGTALALVGAVGLFTIKQFRWRSYD